MKDVIVAMEARFETDEEEEMARSLFEIYKIARFRLDDLVSDSPASDPLASDPPASDDPTNSPPVS